MGPLLCIVSLQQNLLEAGADLALLVFSIPQTGEARGRPDVRFVIGISGTSHQ